MLWACLSKNSTYVNLCREHKARETFFFHLNKPEHITYRQETKKNMRDFHTFQSKHKTLFSLY